MRFESFCEKLVFASVVAFALSASPVHSKLRAPALPKAGERLAAAPPDVFGNGKSLRPGTAIPLQRLKKGLQASLARHGLRVTLSGDEINVASDTPIRVLRKLTALLPGDFEVYVWAKGLETQHHGVLTDLRSEHWMSRHRGARRLRLIAEPFYFYSLKVPGERKPRLIAHAVPRNTAPFERIMIRRKPAWTLSRPARPTRKPVAPLTRPSAHPAVTDSKTTVTDRPSEAGDSDSATAPLGVIKEPGTGDKPSTPPIQETDPAAGLPKAVAATPKSVKVENPYVLTRGRFTEFAAMPLTREPSVSRMAVRLRPLDRNRFQKPRPPADKAGTANAPLVVNAPSGPAPAAPNIDFETIRQRAAFEAASKIALPRPPEPPSLPSPGHTPERTPGLGLALIAGLLTGTLIGIRPLRYLYRWLRGARGLPAMSTALEKSVQELMDTKLVRRENGVDLEPVREALALSKRRRASNGSSPASGPFLVLDEFSRVIDGIRRRSEETDTRRAERAIENRRYEVLAKIAA